MSEFKFACPVCGQHIKCASWQSNTIMECPTCFQKITVPQAPATDDPKLIIAGTKAGGERPIPTAVAAGTPVAPEKHLPIGTFVLVILLCAAGAAWFFFRSRNSNQPPPAMSPPTPPMQQTEQEHGAIGLGAWNTQVEYTNVIVTKGEKTLFRSDFTPGAPGWRIENGTWIATNGVFKQMVIAFDCRAVTGNPEWSDYTLTLRARKLGGLEGFLIMFNVIDDQNWTWWNIGGWGNKQHAIENCVSGAKSMLGNWVPGSIATGRWYDIRIELNKSRIRCYLDGVMIHDVAYPTMDKTAWRKPPMPKSSDRTRRDGDV